ncbi:hypothetical protein CAPTEDRAFT_200922 [Capitella teleta]|uniref:Peptidase M12B domain-containing protein n=1 Tax=Capitella teleta TaxID=283909 RepID=R7TWU0_CAPTE|nr:hypothetical protein CAPTEDRAFT_200922 [Capitella teleta]|eukprot:ELT98077.1 hypothetical protein CAPTEDRAFT_200922 [Capitella teleta]
MAAPFVYTHGVGFRSPRISVIIRSASKAGIRLRIKRNADHIAAVIYDSEGGERVIQGAVSDGDEETVIFSRPEPEAEAFSAKPRNFFIAEGDYTDADLGLLSSKYADSKFMNDFVRVENEVKRSMTSPLHKRGNSAKAVVEILVVVDYSLYEEALTESDQNKEVATQTLREYYKMVIALVDLRYSQMKSLDLKIRVIMAGLFIAEDRTASPWSEFQIRFHRDGMVVDPNDALFALHEWLNDEMDNLPAHDHAMAFTKYPLVANNGHKASGMAYIGTTCQTDGYACSVVEEVGGLTSVGTAVHELGHSLGSKHDGEAENAACPTSDNYVMSPGNAGSSDVRSNFFLFSRCTIREFQRFIQSGKGECLFDSQAGGIHAGITRIGQQYTPDRQCKDMYGDESGLCPLEVDPPEEICSRMWCVKPGNPPSCTTRTSATAIYGTPCGPGKICVLGKCQAKTKLIRMSSMRGESAKDDRQNSVDKEEPLCERDQNAAYCAVIARQTPDACARPDLNLYCCRTCGYLTRVRGQ